MAATRRSCPASRAAQGRATSDGGSAGERRHLGVRVTLLVQVQCAELGVGQFCPALRTVALTKNNEHWTQRMSRRGWRPNGKAIQSVSSGHNA